MTTPTVESLSKEVEQWVENYKRLNHRVSVLELMQTDLYNAQQDLVEWRERIEEREDAKDERQ